MFIFRAIIQGVKSLMLYPLRSMLTMLGIIFGVCSVIAMLAIGEGQKQKAEEEIKKLGAINVIITSQQPIEQEVQGQRSGFVAEYGVTIADAERIADLRRAGVVRVLPEKIRREDITFDKFVKKDRQVYGTQPAFMEFSQAEVVMGRFLSEEDEARKSNVCVISTTLASELFAYQNPLDHEIRVGQFYYRVVGLVRTPADLLQDEKEQQQREIDLRAQREAQARLESKLAEREKLIEQRREKLKTGNAKDRMVAAMIEQEEQISTKQLIALSTNDIIVFQERLEDQDTPESKWFADMASHEYFVTPLNWVYDYNGTHAQLVGNLAHGRVKRMTMETAAIGSESNLGKQNEFYGDVYIPFSTARAFYGDREVKRKAGGIDAKEVQIDRLRVQFDTMDHVIQGAKMLERTMRFGHKDKQDFIIRVPLDELATARKINLIFTIVLATIASISLIVGGIGIMNIMLATVTERTNEIGVRRALGAQKSHITRQFLVETSVLSVAGGLLGIALGLAMPVLAEWVLAQYYQYDLAIIFTTWSVALAFGISVFIGIIFGLYPAIRAANLDPIEALRHS
jgi:ABC-type antimicrobial peptide transport system permease subunit